MEITECFDGHLHLIDGDVMYGSKGATLWRGNKDSIDLMRFTKVPSTLIGRCWASSRIGRRLSRIAVHHIVRINKRTLAVIAFGRLSFFDEKKSTWLASIRINGRRPLVVTTFGGQLIYGEYSSNPSREPMRVFSVAPNGDQKVIAEFSGIRHIHGVSYDPFSGRLWVTTGDDDEECGLWHMDPDGSNMRVSLSGSQQVRIVQPLFTEKYIVFATDSPLEENYIYRITRASERVECVGVAPSSVFYGCKVGKRLFFATVCEPSSCNEIAKAVILSSSEDADNWQEVQTFKKDIWPMKLFQYGQVLFPSGINDGPYVYFTPQGVAGDQRTFRFKVALEV